MENIEDAMCWIDVKMKRGRKITCGFIYREFMVKGDNSGAAQERRWKRVVDIWERTRGNHDVFVMRDMNLDYK